MKCQISGCGVEFTSTDPANKSRQKYCSIKHRRKAIDRRANQKRRTHKKP